MLLIVITLFFRLKNELKEKDNELDQLKDKVKNLQTALTAKPRDESRLHANASYPSEKWASTPNLHPQYSSTIATQVYTVPPVLKKVVQLNSCVVICAYRVAGTCLNPASLPILILSEKAVHLISY